MSFGVARQTDMAGSELFPNDDIGEEIRLALFRSQLEIRQVEQKAN